MATNAPYIAIEGVIGVGKTTLARLLRPRFQAQLLLEAFEENPFLSDFYGDRARYAFQTQIFFLLSRYRQQQTIPQLRRKSAILADYFFAKDRLFARLNVSGDELTMYERLYETLAENVTHPDLVIYLRATTRTLMARIAMRDRPYEREMDEGYIGALRQAYESLFAAYTATPLLVLETDDLDFVREPGDLDEVENRIRAALSGIRQPALLTIGEEVPSPFNWKLPTAAAEPTHEADWETNWHVLGDFLTLTQTVGEVGGALAQHPPLGPQGASEEICDSLEAVSRALNTLARRVGVSIAG
ncbi:MAG: deoxynucleoside kinase, partial [Anaerolineae bacterium]